MKFIIILLIFSGLAFHTSQKLKSDNPIISLYMNWVITLIAINLLISVFIYLFTHSVKKSKGNQGVRGKVGRRGEEGDSDYCNFCVPLSQISGLGD